MLTIAHSLCLAVDRLVTPPRPAAPQAPRLKPPSPLLMLLEGRAPWEWAALAAASPLLGRLPRGDGHAVLVFPGLAAPDITTLPLRKFLRKLGYDAHGWEQGLNIGARHGVVERCRERALALYEESGRPVSLIGWSLGGVYAREIAKELPQQTRCVITLGTPFSGHPHATNAWRLYELVSGQPIDDTALLAQIRRPPAVPTTSIYSRTDGIVSWTCSLNEAGPRVENVEVQASHLGMGANPLALYVIADRLAQDPARWQPFAVQGKRRWFYKTPTRVPVSTSR